MKKIVYVLGATLFAIGTGDAFGAAIDDLRAGVCYATPRCGALGGVANEYLQLGDGTCMECDTHQSGEYYECPNTTIVLFGKNAYQCETTGWGDRWNVIDLPVCADSPVKIKNTAGATYELRGNYTRNATNGVIVGSSDSCLYIVADGVPGYGDAPVRKTSNVCGETHVSFDGTQKPEHDEFLYTSYDAFAAATMHSDSGFVSVGEFDKVFECDNAHCKRGHTQSMSAGHVFRGRIVNVPRTYQCKAPAVGADRWVVMEAGCSYNGQEILEGQWYTINGVRAKLNRAQCVQFDANASRDASIFNAKCEKINDSLQLRCYPVWSDGTPVNPTPVEPIPDTPDEQDVPERTPTCVESRSAAAGWPTIARACCGVASSVALWTPANDPNGECKCVEPNTKFVMSESKTSGYCEPIPGAPTTPTTPGEQYTCPEAVDTSMIQMWREQCATTPTVLTMIDDLEKYCRGENPTQSVYNQMKTNIMANVVLCIPTVAGDVEDTEETYLNVSKTTIKNAHGVLTGIEAGFGKANVWRNEEGKFNTARLASDSIAGVVLGTAGGLITSSVIKKNQIENGFEDIQCTIGGQVVADWGDEFRVGIQ